MCKDFAQLGQFVHVDNAAFRAIKAATPGPYTFILPATGEVPKRLMHPKKRTVGVRIPDHVLVCAILEELGEPILTSTLILPGEEEARTMGWEIKEDLDHVVDIVIEAGETSAQPTTVIDWSGGRARGRAARRRATPRASRSDAAAGRPAGRGSRGWRRRARAQDWRPTCGPCSRTCATGGPVGRLVARAGAQRQEPAALHSLRRCATPRAG